MSSSPYETTEPLPEPEEYKAIQIYGHPQDVPPGELHTLFSQGRESGNRST